MVPLGLVYGTCGQGELAKRVSRTAGSAVLGEAGLILRLAVFRLLADDSGLLIFFFSYAPSQLKFFPVLFPTSRPVIKFPTFSRIPDQVGTLNALVQTTIKKRQNSQLLRLTCSPAQSIRVTGVFSCTIPCGRCSASV